MDPPGQDVKVKKLPAKETHEPVPFGKELMVSVLLSGATGLPNVGRCEYSFEAKVRDIRKLYPVETSLGHSQAVLSQNPRFGARFEFSIPSAACQLVLLVRSSEQRGP